MVNLGDMSGSSAIQTLDRKARYFALWMFILVMAGFLAGYLNKLNLILYLALHLHSRDWPAASVGIGIGVMGFGGMVAFIGGFLGDRTLKRRNWVWIGILVESFGILLISTYSPAAIKIGLALFSLGLLFLQGNIIVVVAEYAAAAGIKVENAFLIVFIAVSIGDLFPAACSGFLYERGLLYILLVLFSLTCALLLLLATRYSSASGNPDFTLIPLGSRRRKALLIFSLLAARGVGIATNFAFRWDGESGPVSANVDFILNQTRTFWFLMYGAIFLAVPLIVLFTLRLLRRMGGHFVAARMIGLGLVTSAFALLTIGLGAENLTALHELILTLAGILISASGAFLFIAIATLICRLVTNRWRGTIAALFASVPPGLNMAPLSWESWPVATPLLWTGAGILVACALWYLLVLRHYAAGKAVSQPDESF